MLVLISDPDRILCSVAEEPNDGADSQVIADEAADSVGVPAAQPPDQKRPVKPSLRKMPTMQLAASLSG